MAIVPPGPVLDRDRDAGWHRGDDGADQLLGQRGGIEAGVVPAEPHLHGDRHPGGADRRLDQPAGMVEVAHQGRARIAADDPLGRTAHVDVDDPGAGAFGDPNGFPHPVRLAAGKLDDVGLDPGPFGAKLRLHGAADELVGRHHLGYDEACSEALGDASEGDVGHPGQGRKNRPRPDLDGTDLEARFA